MTEEELAARALKGLRSLYEYIETEDPWDGPSAADTCEALYELLGRLGMKVS